MIFLLQFGINKHSKIFQRLQIALALRACVIFSGPKYLVSGTRDIPPPEATLSTCMPSQSWPALHDYLNPYILQISLIVWVSIGHLITAGFAELFHFFDTNFCLKSWLGPLRQTRHAERCPG